MNYYYKINNNNYIYSIDMIRLNLELNDKFIDDFNKLLNVFSFDSGCQLNRYISKSFGYHYLYNFIIEEDNKKCSFALGLGLNFNSENKNKRFY